MARPSVQRDGRTDAETLRAAIEGQPVGTVFTYDKLDKVINANRYARLDRGRIQRICTLVSKRYLKEGGRMLINVKDVGYQVASAEEQVVIAGRYTRRGERALTTANDILANTRLAEIKDRNVRLQAREERDRASFNLDMIRSSVTRDARRRAIADRYLETLDTRLSETIAEIEAELVDVGA